MNQILIDEKIYVTPELKKKKKLYKFNFIVSFMLAIILFSYYVYAEYNRDQEDKSDEILAGIEVVEDPDILEEDSTVRFDENGVLVVVLDNIPSGDEVEEVNLEELMLANKNAGSKLDTKVHTTKRGAKYTTVAVIEIPKINIIYPVIYSEDSSNKTTEDLLKISVVKYWGPEANQQGNFCIVGHNYLNKRFFSKASTLKKGDSIYLTDLDNNTLEYKVYDNYIVNPTDLSCTSQVTNGETELTLITCTKDGKQRTVIKARAVNTK